MANEYKHSLTPAQIQYFRIGPKISGSAKSRQKLNEALLERQNIDGSDTSVSLNGIPKHTYGNFEKTVNNFGVLINKNFGE